MRLQDQHHFDLDECRCCDLLVLVDESQGEDLVPQDLPGDEDTGDTKSDHVNSSSTLRGPEVYSIA